MVNLATMSLNWIEKICISNNKLELSVLALDEMIKIECSGIISIEVNYQQSDSEIEEEEIGNIVEVKHEYRNILPSELTNYVYQKELLHKYNYITIEGDYFIRLICRSVRI